MAVSKAWIRTEQQEVVVNVRFQDISGTSKSNDRLSGIKEEIDLRAKSMRQMVWVHMKRAKALIANVEHGEFPDDEMPDETPARFSTKQEAEHMELEAKWWTLDLSSSLSENKLAKALRIHYEGN